jgi:general secretion pathway protein D
MLQERMPPWTGLMSIALFTSVAFLAGCGGGSQAVPRPAAEFQAAEFVLREITSERAGEILAPLELGTITPVPNTSAIRVSASPEDIRKAQVVLDLVDGREPYLIETLAGAEEVRAVPTNAEIARSLGNLAVGTFAAPPPPGEKARAIIDIHHGQIVGIIPMGLHRELTAFLELGLDGVRQVRGGAPAASARDAAGGAIQAPGPEPARAAQPPAVDAKGTPGPTSDGLPGTPDSPPPRGRYLGLPVGSAADPIQASSPSDVPRADGAKPTPAERKESSRPSEAVARPDSLESCSAVMSDAAPEKPELPTLANGDSLLQLDLPPRLDMVQLLDLVGEYLELDCLYDPEKIKGQVVTLRLHGKLRGQMRVKDLYLLLESVLKFKGFVMTRGAGNLVTIVPATDALRAGPDLIDGRTRNLEAGDVVVTSFFDLQHVDAAKAAALLQNMQLSLSVTPVEGMPTLLVTCYAHQIDHIERLLSVIDRPGRAREFRFRQLRYTTAKSLSERIRVLTAEFKNVAVTFTPPAGSAGAPVRPSATPARTFAPRAGSVSSGPAESVFLDADERTNRILMIGYREQLAVIDELIDSLDVAQQDLRVLKIYDMQHVEAGEVKKKLQELEIIGSGSGRGTVAAGKITGVETGGGSPTEEPLVVVLEATNSLVVNASPEQHARIEAMLPTLDAEVRTEAIPYEIYFLENQSPENLAQVLEDIISETVQDKEGKIQRTLRNKEDQIIIVPDKETFALIVYASRKNQEWIGKLISTLDRRRPQVLIDVTLVEIRKSDDFNYDLNLITSLPDLAETGGQTGSFLTDGQRVVDELLASGTRSQFADFQANSGAATGFYADIHINALLQAVQKKNYGRVLAKPKVLVNDNEKGTIKTTDTTYVTKRSSIPVTSGTAGQPSSLIETAVDYQPYDAGITMEITPHISEGDLLRLEMNLSRSDFGVVTGERPPDETSSDITTTVTIPDGSTIILGGMIRLNQTKGGNKVPLLGDIPVLGGLFRSVANSDIQSKLYVFVKAEIIRPAERAGKGMDQLTAASEQDRSAFERSEQQFQAYEDWPGIKPNPVEPTKVLEAR